MTERELAQLEWLTMCARKNYKTIEDLQLQVRKLKKRLNELEQPKKSLRIVSLLNKFMVFKKV